MRDAGPSAGAGGAGGPDAGVGEHGAGAGGAGGQGDKRAGVGNDGKDNSDSEKNIIDNNAKTNTSDKPGALTSIYSVFKGFWTTPSESNNASIKAQSTSATTPSTSATTPSIVTAVPSNVTAEPVITTAISESETAASKEGSGNSTDTDVQQELPESDSVEVGIMSQSIDTTGTVSEAPTTVPSATNVSNLSLPNTGQSKSRLKSSRLSLNKHKNDDKTNEKNEKSQFNEN